MTQTLSLYLPTICQAHGERWFIVEKPSRLAVLTQCLPQWLANESITLADAPFATEAQLALGHRADYIRCLQQASASPWQALFAFRPQRLGGMIQYYTPLSRHSYDAARGAVGAVCAAIDQVQQGATQRALCLVRPPGHHAGVARAEGFCLFNSIAIGARYARQLGYQSVLIIDFDRHHGNGTQEIVGMENGIRLISLHQQNCQYGKKGRELQYSRNLNTRAEADCDQVKQAKDDSVLIAMPAKATGNDFLRVFDHEIAPLINTIQPEIILLSAGFDFHRQDPLSNVWVESEDYFHLTERIVRAAEALGDIPIVSALEGGYHLPALQQSVDYHIRALLSQQLAPVDADPEPRETSRPMTSQKN